MSPTRTTAAGALIFSEDGAFPIQVPQAEIDLVRQTAQLVDSFAYPAPPPSRCEQCDVIIAPWAPYEHDGHTFCCGQCADLGFCDRCTLAWRECECFECEFCAAKHEGDCLCGGEDWDDDDD